MGGGCSSKPQYAPAEIIKDWGKPIKVMLNKDIDHGLGIRLIVKEISNRPGAETFLLLRNIKRKGPGTGRLPVEKSRKIFPGDRIHALNGKVLPKDSFAAAKLLREAAMTLTLTIIPRETAIKNAEEARRNSMYKGVEKAVDENVASVVVKLPEKLARAPKNSKERTLEQITRGSFLTVKNTFIFNFNQLNNKGPMGDAIVHILCREGYAAGLDFCLDTRNAIGKLKKVNLEMLNKKNRTALLCVFTPKHLTASARGQIEIDEMDPMDVQMPPGDDEARERMVVMLCKARAKVNIEDICKVTPLMLAALHGWPDAVTALLERGARPFMKNDTGQTALHLVCAYTGKPYIHGRLEVVGKREEAALALIEGTDVKKRHELVNAQDDDGNTPFLLASANGMTMVMEAMLSLGVETNTPNLNNETPVKAAIRMGRQRAASILLKLPGTMRRKSALDVASGALAEYIQSRQEMDPQVYMSPAARAKQDKAEARERKLMARRGSGGDGREQSMIRVRRRASVDYNKQAGWEQYNDPYNHGRKYYLNTKTGDSQWEPPEGWVKPPKGKKPQHTEGYIRMGAPKQSGWVKNFEDEDEDC
jgi:ankyrin repeat protein